MGEHTKKIKIEQIEDTVRIEIPKENVAEGQGISVAILPKPKIVMGEIPDEKIRECGESLASAMLILIRAKHALEKGDVERADKLLASAPVLLIHAAKACSIEFPSSMSVEIMEMESPEEIKLKIKTTKEEARQELKEKTGA